MSTMPETMADINAALEKTLNQRHKELWIYVLIALVSTAVVWVQDWSGFWVWMLFFWGLIPIARLIAALELVRFAKTGKELGFDLDLYLRIIFVCGFFFGLMSLLAGIADEING